MTKADQTGGAVGGRAEPKEVEPGLTARLDTGNLVELTLQFLSLKRRGVEESHAGTAVLTRDGVAQIHSTLPAELNAVAAVMAGEPSSKSDEGPVAEVETAASVSEILVGIGGKLGLFERGGSVLPIFAEQVVTAP